MLNDLLKNETIVSITGSADRPVSGIQTDSRRVRQGDCFVAVKGTASDGHDHINQALENGATSVICESLPDEIHEGIAYVRVTDSAQTAGRICQAFYGHPSKKLKVVGVTGTNGKTTVAVLLHKLFSALGQKSGLISTIQVVIGDKVLPATHTTPDPVSLGKIMADMVNEGCQYLFMECSSHAIHQGRIAGIEFAGAIFTNISHDHLDYHGTFDEYIRVKKSWFDSLPSGAFALTNADDRRGIVMLQNCPARKKFYSLRTLADFKGKILDNSLQGLHMNINDVDVHFKLIGAFNAYNLLAVYGAAVCLGQDKADALRLLSSLTGAEGRFDYYISPRERMVGIVDYAHTPDALLNVLATIRQLRKGFEKIITVVGCGGNRDKAKRPVMAEVASEHSDKVIFTSDNPRYEDPMDILRDMEAGVRMMAKKKCITIPDRREAIKTAVSLGGREDIILLAGKGHEKYQEVAGKRLEFDDKVVLQEMFGLLEK